MDARTLCAPIEAIKFRRPVCVEVGTPVSEVITMMQRKRVGCILVVDCAQLVGIITERDLLRHLAVKHTPPSGEVVEDIMTESPEHLHPGDPLAFAVNLMHLGKYRHIPLVDEETSIPIGYLSTSDVVRHVGRSINPQGTFYVPTVEEAS